MYSIHQLVDQDGVLYAPTPDLLAQCAEILDAQARAAEAARLATVRERLAGLLPVTTARPVNGDVLATSLFAKREDN